MTSILYLFTLEEAVCKEDRALPSPSTHTPCGWLAHRPWYTQILLGTRVDGNHALNEEAVLMGYFSEHPHPHYCWDAVHPKPLSMPL